jgi:thiol-disulfide isomerase/thioredoxin
MSKLPGTSVSIGHDSPARGKPAPTIDLIPLTDTKKLARIDSLPAGKVVLLHIWGTWCGPCKMEYPGLSAMAKKWETSNRFQFLPVSCESHPLEPNDTLLQKTQDYFDQADIESYAYCDPNGRTRQSVAKRLERDGMYYPTTMLIQQDGSIAGVWEGFNEGGVDQMHEAIRYLLNR